MHLSGSQGVPLPGLVGIVAPDWPAPANVRALVTTRRLPGNSQPPFDAFNLGLRCGERGDIVQANRTLLARAFALPSAPCWLRQVHGRGVALFGPSGWPAATPPGGGPHSDSERETRATLDALPEPEADAAITRERGVVLAILTADCLPILLCAEDGSEIGAVHAGWRGLAAGVIEACVGRMQAPAARIAAWLGPAIGPASYEVGAEVRHAFVAQSPAADAAFMPTRPDHWTCDLYTLARQRLAGLGVGRIAGGGFDTRTDPRFYSHRRDGAGSGRFASLIWIS